MNLSSSSSSSSLAHSNPLHYPTWPRFWCSSVANVLPKLPDSRPLGIIPCLSPPSITTILHNLVPPPLPWKESKTVPCLPTPSSTLSIRRTRKAVSLLKLGVAYLSNSGQVFVILKSAEASKRNNTTLLHHKRCYNRSNSTQLNSNVALIIRANTQLCFSWTLHPSTKLHGRSIKRPRCQVLLPYTNSSNSSPSRISSVSVSLRSRNPPSLIKPPRTSYKSKKTSSLPCVTATCRSSASQSIRHQQRPSSNKSSSSLYTPTSSTTPHSATQRPCASACFCKHQPR
jgi:hypothetical protein